MSDAKAPTKTKPAAARAAAGGVMGSTWIGVAGALALLAYVFTHEGDAIYYLNLPGGIIVVGGVAVVALIAFRWSEISNAVAAMFAIFREEKSLDADIRDLLDVSRLIYERRIQAADERLRRVGSPFLKLGLQFVIDGANLEDTLQIMNWRIQKLIEHEHGQARLFRTLASFAPAFGLLGTLVGMVGMLKELGAGDIGRIGTAMAVAMLATLYGLILANLVFKPIAIKLEQRTIRRVDMLNVLLQGIVLAHLGRSPTLVAEALDHMLRESGDEVAGA
ncbi:MAG: MotA/TolQ/ExbB proton channel family protein [Alphaproteobacteria bacterium]|jgi:chemotaxis protein MotA|nr:MotA/TolQ/ExbB proton channel family protein [Alphaproteobacteria bacterium]